MSWILALLLFSYDPLPAQPVPIAPDTPKRIAELIAKTDGATAERAFKVRSVREEYQIVKALGLQVRSQALVSGKKGSYDRLTVADASGNSRELWFDVSSFFGAGIM